MEENLITVWRFRTIGDHSMLILFPQAAKKCDNHPPKTFGNHFVSHASACSLQYSAVCLRFLSWQL